MKGQHEATGVRLASRVVHCSKAKALQCILYVAHSSMYCTYYNVVQFTYFNVVQSTYYNVVQSTYYNVVQCAYHNIVYCTYYNAVQCILHTTMLCSVHTTMKCSEAAKFGQSSRLGLVGIQMPKCFFASSGICKSKSRLRR